MVLILQVPTDTVQTAANSSCSAIHMHELSVLETGDYHVLARGAVSYLITSSESFGRQALICRELEV